jgi:hypothetical protein
MCASLIVLGFHLAVVLVSTAHLPAQMPHKRTCLGGGLYSLTNDGECNVEGCHNMVIDKFYWKNALAVLMKQKQKFDGCCVRSISGVQSYIK